MNAILHTYKWHMDIRNYTIYFETLNNIFDEKYRIEKIRYKDYNLPIESWL